ncbi:MAG: DNA primase [Ruminococcus sp.]|nr:DNA primase [Ruminococcus sp.]
MNYDNENLEELLEYINPSTLDYQEWLNVGLALKRSGYDASVWDAWSAQDAARYHPGECEKKYLTFDDCDTPVTAGTLVHMAKENGWMPKSSGAGKALDWDDIIDYDDYQITSPEQTEQKPIMIPDNWNPAEQIAKYLETLFEPDDFVGYVTECWQNSDGKYLPTAGSYSRTASQLIQELQKYQGDFDSVFGTPNPSCGAWIRFNPLDGKGAKNENVTEFRFALVESDKIPIEQQNGILHELQLPIAALVYSGKKSLHAIVRIDAANYDEYRKRVEFLYQVCDRNGLQVDRQNKNPSRLSRMPGVMRGEQKQFLLETNIGFSSWNEWKDYIDGISDDLPEFESMASAWEHMPELAPPLIENVLRQGHKMLLAGASKAGKSFALIELCIAIAEGRKWLGWQCAQGKVLYVNLELDRASCLHRFKDVYQALQLQPQNLNAIDIWNLRGVSEPLDKLAPKLIRRARKRNYLAVIVDPIYKVITGDENSADQMANFCNQFDKICHQLECAVIYCHHHSKGAQGGKRSMDRASGSGVFARDPDALLDMTDLNLTPEIITQIQNQNATKLCCDFLKESAPEVWADVPQDDTFSRSAMLKHCIDNLNQEAYQALQAALIESDKHVSEMTAWRMEGTLREFPRFPVKNLWFRYPLHEEDKTGILKDLQLDVQLSPRQYGAKKGHAKQSAQAKAKSADKTAELLNTFDMVNVDGIVKITDIAEFLGISRDTAERRVKKCKELSLENGTIRRVTP